MQIITLVISREEEAISAATSFSEAGRNQDYATMAKYLLGRDNKPLTPEETERNFQGVMGSFKYERHEIVPANFFENLIWLPSGRTKVFVTLHRGEKAPLCLKVTLLNTDQGMIIEKSPYCAGTFPGIQTPAPQNLSK